MHGRNYDKYYVFFVFHKFFYIQITILTSFLTLFKSEKRKIDRNRKMHVKNYDSLSDIFLSSILGRKNING